MIIFRIVGILIIVSSGWLLELSRELVSLAFSEFRGWEMLLPMLVSAFVLCLSIAAVLVGCLLLFGRDHDNR